MARENLQEFETYENEGGRICEEYSRQTEELSLKIGRKRGGIVELKDIRIGV